MRTCLYLCYLLAFCCIRSALGEWTPNFTLSIDRQVDQAHPEAVVPEVCDVAKRPVIFHLAPRHRPQCFDPNRRLDVVVAFSVEDIAHLSQTISTLLSAPAVSSAEPCFLVGSKVRNASEVLAVEGVDTVFELGNAGREWSVYLTYLISYYTNLPQHVMLVHGRLNFPAPELLPRLAMFGPSTGVLGMGGYGKCPCRGCALPAPTHRIRELWSIFRRSFCPQSYQTFLNGHYIMSRKRILDNSVDLYKVVYRYVMHAPGHYLALDAHEQMSSAPGHSTNFVEHLRSCEDTLGGHIVERAWSFLFNCYQQPHKETCLRSAAQVNAAAAADPAAAAASLDPTCAYSNWQCYDSMPPWPINTTHYIDGRPYVIIRT